MRAWFTTRSNMADEREYYTSTTAQPGRASSAGACARALALRHGRERAAPVSYGPWSPIYTNYNPPFSTGPMPTMATVSSSGVSDASTMGTHKVMPAFVYSGNTSIWSTTRSSIASRSSPRGLPQSGLPRRDGGSPAYVPREIGPLIAVDVNALTDARGHFLKFGTEPGLEVRRRPRREDERDGSGTTGDGDHTGLPPSQVINAAKVDLWDSDWEGGRYYWTVIPVDEVPAQQVSTTLASGSVPGDTVIDVADATGINAGDALRVGASRRSRRRSPRWPGTRSRSPLRSVPPIRAGDPVVRPAGAVTYMEDELTQDACASGRVQSFAKASDPVVTTESETPFASGLSPDGKLVSAKTPAPRFYGYPLVAWQPIVSAGQYKVQWSREALPVDDGRIPAHLEHVADACRSRRAPGTTGCVGSTS